MRRIRFSPVTLVMWVLILSLFAPQPTYSQQTQTIAPTGTVDAAAVPGTVLPDEIPLQIGEKESRYTKQEGTNSLEIRFCDPKNSKDYCYAPARMLNRSGTLITSGVALEPAFEGEWRWTTDYTLQFSPKKTWPAGQAYKVKFDATLFPPYVKLNVSDWSFATEPLLATISSMQFFQDPNDVGKKLVSTIASFNYPVITEQADKNIQFFMEEVGANNIVVRGKQVDFKTEWNEEKTQVSITTPLGKLGEAEQFMRAEFGAGISPLHGGNTLVTSEGKATERVLIPSLYSYAQIQSVSATIVKNAKFEPEQILVVQTNVPVSAAELAAHLKLRLLPKDKAAVVEGASPKKDYAWSSPTEVKPELLKEAPEVPYTALPIATKESTLHSLKFSAEPNRWVYTSISKGMRTYGDFVLGKDYENTLQVPAYTREVKILPAEGSVLSLSGDKKITLFSLGVDSLEVEMGRVLPESVNHLISQSSGSFSNPYMNDGFSLDSISERIVKTIKLPGDSPTKPVFTGFDFGEYVDARPTNKGMFFFTVRSKEKDKNGVERVVSEDSRFILVTDLGFLVKKNLDGTREVFVQSLDDGDSVYGATVEVLGKNGLPVTSAVTNWSGHAVIPDLTGMEREKEPVAFLVHDGRDMSFMPFERYDRALNYSAYEVGGESSAANGLRAFLFSDRGIYRPGEEVHIGMVVKQGDWTTNMDGLPLFLEIMNSRGQYITQKPVKLNAEGFIETSFSTKDTSPTGNYHVSLSLANDGKAGTQLGTTSVRIEEFQPDTMKITSKFNKENVAGWVSPEKLEASINLMNLYGTPAANHRITGNINIAPSYFSFDAFKDYSFFDAKSANKSFDQPLTETLSDDNGDATFPLDLKPYGDSTYRLTFYAEGFEEGSGRSVKTAKSILVSSQPYVVGYKADGPLSYINEKSARNVTLAAVDSNLKLTAAPDLKIETYAVTYIQSLVQGSGGYSYQSVAKEELTSMSAFALDAKEKTLALDTAKAGEFIVRIKNKDGLIVSMISYSVVGDADVTGGTKKNNVVEVKLKKQSYEPGEKIEMSLVSPYTGSGLITIETDKVIAYEWFEASTTSSVQHITIPKDFAGKGYVNVQFLRGRNSKEIYTNPLSIGIASFMVGTDALDSKISLTVPEMIKPGQELPISFYTRKPSKIVVYAIDEGILQYGRYKTPDPMKYLVGNRALQVETYQILDQLLPEYSIMQQMSAFGGDMSLSDGKNLNPFKRKSLPPVVYWSGIIDADQNVKEVKYMVPEYFNGSLRVMAVAVSAGSVGAMEAKTTVRADLIVSPNAPLFVAPTDIFDVVASVANNIKGSGKASKIEFSVEPSEGLEIVEGTKQTLAIDEGKEGVATIKVKAKDVLGNADLKFTVSKANSQARFTASMSVRPPVASNTELLTGYIDKGEKILKWKRTMYKEFGEAQVNVSGLPMSLIPGLVKYLKAFPCGCSEQIISQTFPTLVLHDDPDFHATFKEAPESIAATFTQMLERQSSDNGIGLWWSGESSNPFVSIYALHFMTVAKEKNFPVPVGLFNNDLQYVRQYVNRSVTSLEQARLAAYGIYVLTRNGEVTTNYLPYLLQYLEQNKKGIWENDITAMYIASTYKMLQLDAEANAMLKLFNLGEPKYWAGITKNLDIYYNDLSRHSLYLYLLSEHFPEKLRSLDKKVLLRVANFVSEGSYNTISSSYAILGINAYAKAQSVNLAKVTVATVTPDGVSGDALKLSGQKILSADFPPHINSLKISSPDDGLFYLVATSGFDSGTPDKPLHNGIEVTRSYETKEGTPISEVAIGDTVYVRLNVRSYNDIDAANIALVDLLPGGFEAVPESLRDASVQANNQSEQEGEVESAPSTLDSRNTWSPDAVDIREDRALLMGTFTPYAQDFIYRIKAVNTGTFITPPAFAGSMYERAISSKGIQGTLRVVKEKPPEPAAAISTDAPHVDTKLPAELPR